MTGVPRNGFEPPVTVAVKVTDCPNVGVLGLTTSAVVVALGLGAVTVMFTCPKTVPLPASITVKVGNPAVLNLTEKLPRPLTRGASAGKIAVASLLVK